MPLAPIIITPRQKYNQPIVTTTSTELNIMTGSTKRALFLDPLHQRESTSLKFLVSLWEFRGHHEMGFYLRFTVTQEESERNFCWVFGPLLTLDYGIQGRDAGQRLAPDAPTFASNCWSNLKWLLKQKDIHDLECFGRLSMGWDWITVVVSAGSWSAIWIKNFLHQPCPTYVPAPEVYMSCNRRISRF